MTHDQSARTKPRYDGTKLICVLFEGIRCTALGLVLVEGQLRKKRSLAMKL